MRYEDAAALLAQLHRAQNRLYQGADPARSPQHPRAQHRRARARRQRYRRPPRPRRGHRLHGEPLGDARHLTLDQCCGAPTSPRRPRACIRRNCSSATTITSPAAPTAPPPCTGPRYRASWRRGDVADADVRGRWPTDRGLRGPGVGPGGHDPRGSAEVGVVCERSVVPDWTHPLSPN